MKSETKFISLSVKTIVLLLIVFFFMLIGTTEILKQVMLQRFESIEQHLLSDHMTRSRNALDDKIDDLDKIVFDWAVWDDTYAFIDDQNPNYVASNLINEVYRNLEIDAMVFIDQTGEFVYAMASDESTGTLVPIPAGLDAFIRSSVILNNSNPSTELKGLVQLPEGLMMIATSPILPSNGVGEVKGNLLLGYWLDESFASSLRNQLQLDLVLSPVSERSNQPIEREFSLVGEEFIQVQGTVQDLSGKPVLMISIESDREIYDVGEEGVNQVRRFILFMSAMSVIGISLFMNTHFLSKLKYIIKSVDHIGKEKDFSKRLTKFIGNDEFSIVVHEINGMLDDLEKVQNDHVYKANHDVLTELPNRRLLSELMMHALRKADREQTVLAVLFLDLDDFKTVNDGYGHDIGDETLVQVVKRLKATLRKSDVIARIGGDEFIIFLEKIDQIETIEKVAVKILECFDTPVNAHGHEIKLSTSVGISVYPRDGQDPDTLFKHADRALYQAKEIGKARYAFFSAVASSKEHDE
jgi:diguanylate cyclase (GGDEF)-like protein